RPARAGGSRAGPGFGSGGRGRFQHSLSAMDISKVCILGGSGFVGRAIADHLTAQEIRVRVVTRSLPRARAVTVLPTVEVVVADPHDTASLARCFDDMDAVINLV